MARTTTNLGLKVWNLGSDTFNIADLAYNWDAIDADYSRARSADRVEVLSALPGAGLFDGRLVYLTAASGGFAAKTVVRYDGSAWRAVGPLEVFSSLPISGNYQGRIVALTSASGGFAANDVVINIDSGSTWKKIGGIPSGTSLPGSPVAGDVFLTTAATGGFDSYSLVAYNGSAWTRTEKRGVEIGSSLPGAPYAGQVFTLTAAASGFNAYDVVRYNGSSWERLGMPAGAITQFAGSAAPTGWLICDGSEVSRTTYAGLDTAIGTTYGAYTNGSGAAGTTHLVLPDLRGRVAVGKGTHADVDSLGENDGTAVASRRPKHSHSINDPGHTHSILSSDGTAGSAQTVRLTANNTGSLGATNSSVTGITVGVTGTTDAPSYIVLNYIIKT